MKNGKLEFYRFIFCIAVLFFHLEMYIMGEPSLDSVRIMLFPHGNMGVEFFLILTGFLMAKSAFKAHNTMAVDDKPMSRISVSNNLRFVGRKYLRLFPEHAVAFIFTFIVYIICHHCALTKIISLAVQNIPSFFLIQMSGIYLFNVNHIEWYLSTMMIVIALIYPLCRRYYYGFTRYIAPLFSLIILGIMFYNTKSLSGVMTWIGFGYKSTFRALVEISLGTTAYEITRVLKNKGPFSKQARLWITIVEAGCLILVLLYMLMTFPRKYEYYAMFLILILVICAGTKESFGSSFFDKPFFYFLGEWSYPIYVSQLISMYIANAFLTSYSMALRIVIATAITVVASLIVYFVSKPIKTWTFSKIKI